MNSRFALRLRPWLPVLLVALGGVSAGAAVPAEGQPPLACATLTYAAFTDEQFAALEQTAPQLHSYLASGMFEHLDARSQYRLVASLFATENGTDAPPVVDLDPHAHLVTGTSEEKEIFMDAYSSACDRLLELHQTTLMLDAQELGLVVGLVKELISEASPETKLMLDAQESGFLEDLVKDLISKGPPEGSDP